MANPTKSDGSSWVAFLAGAVLVAIIALGFVAYTGGFNREAPVAQSEPAPAGE